MLDDTLHMLCTIDDCLQRRITDWYECAATSKPINKTYLWLDGLILGFLTIGKLLNSQRRLRWVHLWQGTPTHFSFVRRQPSHLIYCSRSVLCFKVQTLSRVANARAARCLRWEDMPPSLKPVCVCSIDVDTFCRK